MPNTPLFCPVLEQRKKFTDYRFDVWGDSFGWYRTRTWETIKYIVFHHSVTTPTPNPKSDVDYIAEIHKRRGWAGIGYHFVVTSDGMVWYVGDISVQRANVADKNHLVIGVCLVGDFTQGNPTDDQILSSHDLAKYLISEVPALINVKNKGWDAVVGHKELQSTQCPGTYWQGVDDSIYNRIVGRIPYTPQPILPPEINWREKFDDLKSLYDNETLRLIGEKELAVKEKVEADKFLAECKQKCQREKLSYEQIIENLKSENPKIPKIDDFTDSIVFNSAVKRLLKKLKLKK